MNLKFGKCRLALIAIIALIFIMPVAFAATPPKPYPIMIKVITNIQGASGLKVDIQNIRTGQIETYTTNEYGEVPTDVTQKFSDFRDTDSFKVTILNCKENSKCIKTDDLTDGYIFLTFDLTDVICLPCPECPVCQTCPSCPADTTPYSSCSSCCTEKECPDEECPVPLKDYGWLGAGILALIAGAVMGNNGVFQDREKKQFKEYISKWTKLEPKASINIILKRTESGELQIDGRSHGHKGQYNQHSIWKEHKTYWHPKGIQVPIYDADGKYIGEVKDDDTKTTA